MTLAEEIALAVAGNDTAESANVTESSGASLSTTSKSGI
jgi:hypothetical protein